MYNDIGDQTYSSNKSVIFSNNTSTIGSGGAIYHNYRGTTYEDNQEIVFSSNTAAQSGGAIYNVGTLIFNQNTSITFTNNTAAGSGGAIYNSSSLTLDGNTSISFSNNTATGSGGAIYNTSALTISGNGDVTFRGNAETGEQRLRSLYSVNGVVTLSAPEDGSITFYDSIYIAKSTTSKFELNAGGGKGAIVFSGATTEEDWERAFGSAPTAEQVTASRTSEIYSSNTLYGGSLVVRDEAILKGGSLGVASGAGATVLLDKGHMQWTGTLSLNSGNTLHMRQGSIDLGAVTLGSGSTLRAADANSIAGNLMMGAGSAFHFDIEGSSDSSGTTPMLTVGGTLKQSGKLDLLLSAPSGLGDGVDYALLKAPKFNRSLWTMSNVHVDGSDYAFGDLRWVGDTLYLSSKRDVYFYGTSREGSLSWDGLATWSADDTYEAGSATSFMDGDRVHLEREGRLALTGSAEAHSVNVHLENGSDTVEMGLSGEGGLKVTNVVHVEQGNLVINAFETARDAAPTGAINASALEFDRGYTDTHIRFSGSGAGANATLTLNGGQDFSGLTLKWDTPDAGTLSQGTGACWIDCWTIDMETTKLVVGNYAGSTPTTASKLIQLDPKSVVFTKNGTNHAAYLPDKNLYDFNPYQAWLRNNNLTTEYGSTAPKAFIYQGDVYYGSMQTSNLQALSQDGTWWAPQSGTRVVYDTEKLGWPSSGTAPTLPEDIGKLDKASCALCVAMNMAGFWMDKYAPLMATDTKPVGLAVGGAHTSPYAPTNVLYLPFWKDDSNEAGLAGNVLQWILTGEGLNTRKGGILVPQPNGYAVFPKGWWGIDTGTTVPDNFRAMDGMIYTCKVDEGWLAPDDFTKIMLAAMRDSDTPIALGYSQNFADARTDSLPNHVVTCWGYESAKIEDGGDIRDVITKVWITDSDDSTCRDSPKQVLDVVYSGDGVYLLNPETDHNVIKKVTLVSFMTTPEGMDDMLEQYQSAWTPAYWTGLKGDGLWDADTSVITYDENGQLVKQTRMAETSDGWSKHCYAYGYDKEVWAHTVFTGQEAYAVFADSVNGRTLTAAQKKVHTLGLEAPRLWAEVTGKGYAFLTGGPGEAATISIGCLSLSNGATLEIGEGVTLSASWVELRDKSVLENHGRIEGWVEMSPGATFISGLVQVTREESAGDLGNGFYACSMENGLNPEMLEWGWNPVELSGGGTYTLGTTFDLAGLDTIWKAAFKLYTPDEREAYILGMFGLAETADTTFKFDVRYIHDSLFDTAAHVRSSSQTCLYASSFEISGDAEEAITIGSGMSAGDSAADIQVSETFGGQVTAQDAHVATVAGEDVYFCADTSVDARVFTVTAGSRLTNNGVLEAAEGILVDGSLDGSGRFGGTVVREGGELSLGGTSDAPSFGSLAVEDGARLVFHVDEGTAESGCQLRVEDGLTLADGADVTILLTPGYVVSDAIGKNTTWNLVETGAEAGDGLAASMQACTSFRVAWEDGEATLDQLGMQVRRSSWTQEGGSLVLNATLGYVHNGVLTWDNDAGNRAWDTVSGNWLDEEGYGDIFVYGYTCRFTDVGAGAVTLAGDLDPDAVEVDAAADYVFGGAGRIINGSLVKKGEGSLTINTANIYAGGTVIEGGTVVVGDADALGTGVVQIKGGGLVLDNMAIANDVDIAAGGTGRILLGTSYIECADADGAGGEDGRITGATVSHTTADGTETTGIRGTEQAHAVVDNVRIDLATAPSWCWKTRTSAAACASRTTPPRSCSATRASTSWPAATPPSPPPPWKAPPCGTP